MSLVNVFSELSKGDASIAGGKGASLGEMTQAGIPVPPGFVILSSAFERFLEETDLNVEINATLDSVDAKEMHTVENASEKIQSLILAAKMPEDIAQEIQAFYAKLDSQYVAVRSSATAEDSASAAWAGQLDSFLNTTKETLLTNVQRCWASLFTPRAIFYRFEKELHTQKISVAVVVQKMVESEISGIAFSVHPVTEDRNQLIIEAGFGLGEAIVSGAITPDSYVVEKEQRRIIDTNVSTQTRALYRVDSGGNEWRDIPEPRASSQVLTESQILELAELIIKIENHYGFPCDVEWAFEGEKFYIVQSRPITTLSISTTLPEKLSKIYSRKKTLLYFSVWNEADIRGTIKYLGTPLSLSLFLLPPKGDHEAWYSPNEITELEEIAISKLSKDPSLIEQIGTDLETAWDKLKDYFVDGKSLSTIEEAKTYYEHLVQFWMATNTVFFELPNRPEVPESFTKRILAMRETTQEYTDEMSEKFVQFFEHEFPAYKEYASVVMFEDIESLRHGPSQEFIKELSQRKSVGCLLFSNKVYPLSFLPELSRINHFQLERTVIDSTAGELRGTTGYLGIVTGRVRIVLEKEHLNKVQAGDILVAPMTKVEYIPAIKRSSAVITDEGGVTCHAAIVARELKIPCIIGTKVATQVLHDGDLVEVDADNGFVRIIERA